MGYQMQSQIIRINQNYVHTNMLYRKAAIHVKIAHMISQQQKNNVI